MKYEYCVFIGRFSPFHRGHYSIIQEALKQAEKVIVVLGSYKRAPDPKNPWTAGEREKMMRASLTKEENEKITVICVRDYFYNDNLWIADLTQQVFEATDGSENIALIGHEHDKSSYYLNLFPKWTSIKMKNIDEFPHATELRYMYFTQDAGYKKYLHEKTVTYLEEFKKTESFKVLKASFDSLREYRAKWEGAPFKPTFVTVDAVVVKSGHLLVVRRKGAYGKGLIALPGGFLNQDETIKAGMLRELKEETAIKVDKSELEKAIQNSQVYDHPERSLRGKTITHAFYLDLGYGPLPQVKGQDDADRAWWISLRDFALREEECFEDHFQIADDLIKKGKK